MNSCQEKRSPMGSSTNKQWPSKKAQPICKSFEGSAKCSAIAHWSSESLAQNEEAGMRTRDCSSDRVLLEKRPPTKLRSSSQSSKKESYIFDERQRSLLVAFEDYSSTNISDLEPGGTGSDITDIDPIRSDLISN